MYAPISEIHVGQLSPEALADMVVLDVREDDEWAAGHIDGAVHVPMMSIPGRLAEIPADRSVLVVCRVGSRSAQVTAFLEAQGRRAANLAGGLKAWESAGQPLVAEAAAPPHVL